MPRSVAVRAGSPFTGLGPVFMKELADHLSSVRMMVLTLFVIVFGAFPVASSLQQLKSAASAVSTLGSSEVFLFLRIFTIEPEQVQIPFFAALNFIIPLMAIGLGFDSVNSEFNRRTLSRVLSQPIYRDALLLGKFLAGLTTLAVALVALWLIVLGSGLVLLGIPPTGSEVARALGFLDPTAQPGNLAAEIGFNSAFSYDFDPNDGSDGPGGDGIDAGKTDFEAVATHEIGHALGFISNSGGTTPTPAIWDLFRFRTGTTTSTFTTAQRIMTIGGPDGPASGFLQYYFVPGSTELGLSTGGPSGSGSGGAPRTRRAARCRPRLRLDQGDEGNGEGPGEDGRQSGRRQRQPSGPRVSNRPPRDR